MVVRASEREEEEEEEEVLIGGGWGARAGAASVELDVCALRFLLMGF